MRQRRGGRRGGAAQGVCGSQPVSQRAGGRGDSQSRESGRSDSQSRESARTNDGVAHHEAQALAAVHAQVALAQVAAPVLVACDGRARGGQSLSGTPGARRILIDVIDVIDRIERTSRARGVGGVHSSSTRRRGSGRARRWPSLVTVGPRGRCSAGSPMSARKEISLSCSSSSSQAEDTTWRPDDSQSR
jgi:hypothetical protein